MPLLIGDLQANRHSPAVITAVSVFLDQTSSSPVGLAEHRGCLGVGHEFPDLLRTAASG
jgi:hypothetical protein